MPPTDPSADKPVPDSQSGETSLPVVDLPSEGDIDLGSLQSRAGDEIPLASLPEPPSGQSLTSWTEVIRRQRAVAQAGQASAADVRVDAPSDKDILIRFDDVLPRRRTGDTSEILPGELPVFTAPSGRSESDIDLGRGGLGGTGESEVKFDILYPPSDAAGAMPAPGREPLSGVDFRAATPVPPASGEIPFAAVVDPPASGVNLGADTGPPGEAGRSSILDALLPDAGPRPGGSASVLDFGSVPPAPPARPARPTVPTAAAQGPSVPTPPAVDLGSNPGSKADVSGRDLVDPDLAMASEDAIDLYAEPAASPNITDSGTLEISEQAIEESQRKAEMQESSSVDLSSRPSYHGELERALEAPSAVGGPSDSDIDLNLPAGGDDQDSSMIHRGAAEVDPDALAAEFKAPRKAPEPPPAPRKPAAKAHRTEVVPARERREPGGKTAYLVGGVLGLVLGVGGVLAAYFAGALPGRQPAPKGGAVAAADTSAEVARLKQDADAARKEAADAKADTARQVAGARKAGEDENRQLADAKAAGEAEVRRLMQEAQKARTDLTAANKAVADARTAEQAARTNLAAATKAAADAQKDATEARAARKAAEDAAAGLTKAVKDAGLDPAKLDESIKGLIAARTVAEAKAKDADARVKAADAKAAEAAKKLTDLGAVADAAKKSAEDAARARDASDATVKAVAERFARGRFVGDKADAAAILKGIDDAVKAGGSDATKALRDELAKVRADEEMARGELTAAKDKEAAATKAAAAATAKAQKAAADLARVTTDTAKLKQDAATAIAKAAAAEKAASEARATADKAAAEARTATERTATEVARLKAENDRLTRDLDAVKELAELIKTPAGAITGPVSKPDPDRLAEEFFGDGLRAFHHGQYTDAESAFRKALQFRPNDARYHYLLGLTLWERKETAGAEAEFGKGRDLELAARPSSRAVSAALERIQGSARQAVDAYRP